MVDFLEKRLELGVLLLMILKMAASSLLEIPVSGCGPVEDSDIIERGIDLFKIVLTKLLRT